MTKWYYGDVTVIMRSRQRVMLEINDDRNITKKILLAALNNQSDVAAIEETTETEDLTFIEVEEFDLDPVESL